MKYLVWVEPEVNKYRKYSLFIQDNIFGSFDLIRSWGRINGKSMRSLTMTYSNIEEAYAEMKRIIKQKMRKGYLETSIPSSVY